MFRIPGRLGRCFGMRFISYSSPKNPRVYFEIAKQGDQKPLGKIIFEVFFKELSSMQTIVPRLLKTSDPSV